MLVSVTEKISGEVMERAIFEPFVSEHEVMTPPPQFVVWPGNVPSSPNPIAQDTRVTHVTAGKMAKTANEYLYRIADKLTEEGFLVFTQVLMGDPAKEIVHFAEQQKADLVLIASRGKSGLNRWNIENIAAKIHAKSSVPVLLVKPEVGFKETKRKRKGVSS
jgi:nucleotide-binding universal stress UspA family protein